MKEYIVTATLDGERSYFMGLLPNGNASWTTQRGRATRFQVLPAALDTARAMKVGEVIGMWDGATYGSPTGTTATTTETGENRPAP